MNFFRVRGLALGFGTLAVGLQLSGPAAADDGLYLGLELGASASENMDVWGSANDVATTCDEFFVVRNAETLGCDAPPSSWVNTIDGASGILAGAQLGLRRGNWRFEGEYFFRSTDYDDINPVRVNDAVLGNKLDQEIELAVAGVNNYGSHNLFANVYYDFRTESRFTPYAGVGIGYGSVSMDYFQTWKRNDDPQYIRTFPNNPDGSISDLNRRLAGTTSVGDDELKDTLFGYQVLAGVDYALSDTLNLGLKLRKTWFNEFFDTAEYQQLRSHDSARGPGGARVEYFARSEDIGAWGLSLVAKYAF